MSQLIENFLKVSGTTPHLRILTIIEIYEESATGKLTGCFGVFVGCTEKTSFQGDFLNLLWDGKITKPAWGNIMPLWCMPLKDPNNSGDYAIDYETDLKESYTCGRIVFKFYNKSNGILKSWKDYCFIPNKNVMYQTLQVPCTSFKFDSKLGSRHIVSEKASDGVLAPKLNIWISDKQRLNHTANEKSLLTFEGITSEIIAPNEGATPYPEFCCFLGVGKRKDGFWPIFSVNTKDEIDGGDVPIRWHITGWLDDLLYFNIGDAFKFNIKNDYEDSDKYTSKKIFNNNIIKQTAWVCRTDNETSISLFVADVKTLSGNLKSYLSTFPTSQLNTYLFYFYEDDKVTENKTIICNITNTNNLINSWNKNTLEQAKAILKNKGSQPIGIVPKIDSDAFNSLTIKYDNVNGNNADFDKVYLNKDLNAKLTFPLIKPTTYKSKINRLSELIEKPTDPDNKYNISISNAKIQTAKNNNKDNGSIFAINIVAGPKTKANNLNNFILVDGSFSLKMGDYKEKDQIIDKLQINLQLRNAQRPLFLWQWYEGIDEQDYIEFCYSINKFRIPIQEVKAFGNDLINKEKIVAPSSVGAISEGYGERSEPTLVIPIKGKNTGNSNDGLISEYFLNLSESSNVAQDYRLEIQLEEKNPNGEIDNTSKVEAIVLNSAPQQIAKVTTDFLRSPITDDGIYILARKSNFSIDSGTWEIYTDKALEEGFKLTLPSQAIGEAYVKSKSNNDGEPKEGDVVDSRFSPTAVLHIANEQLDRNYVNPAWNLKNIWGEVGNSNPGLQLIKAQFELLYGLSAELKNKDAFISELALKLGAIPNPPQSNIVWEESEAQKKAFRDMYLTYLQLYRAWQSRLSILEVSSINRFKTVKFTEGIGYSIRKEENRFNADGSIVEEGAQLKWPIKNQDSPNETDKKYHNKNGLAGGAFYPFESLGVYEELWKQGIKKGSSSGEIENLAFTSLGGYGKQTARFSGDKTIIKSTTSLGRTHFHAVERIGRIGVLWNKAKHVIEYERTVVPSLQFKGDQEDLLGRPIVRKVREYIEILEPIRNYPDLNSSYQQSSGSIIGSNFKSIKIAVSSSWGRNVINNKDVIIGWEIPLWNKHANQEIYPIPQILLELLTAKSADVKSVLTQIENVQDIYFYTDVRPDIQYYDDKGTLVKSIIIDAHTNNWPTVKYVDFTDLPMVDLNKGTEPSLGDTPELMDAVLPAPINILPGYERFSFMVKPSEVTSSVNGRYVENSEINGKLRVVTMMRSKSNGNPKDSDTKPVTQLDDQNPLEKALNTIAYSDGNILNHFTNGFTQTNAQLVSGIIPTKIDVFITEIYSKVKTLESQIKPIQEGLCEKPKLKYLTIPLDINDLTITVWTVSNNFELPTRLLWKKTIESSESFIGTIITNYDLLITEVTKSIINGIQQSDITVHNYIKNLDAEIDSQITSVKRILEQFSFEISSVANEAMEFLQERKVEVIDTVNDTFYKQIAGLLSNLKNDIEKIDVATIDEAKEKAKEIILKGQKDIFDQIENNNLLKKLNEKFEIKPTIIKLVKKVNDEIDSIEVIDLNEILQKAKDIIDELKTDLKSFIDEIKVLENKIPSVINAEANEIKQGIAKIDEQITILLNAIINSISSEEFKKKVDDHYKNYKEQKNKFVEELQTSWEVVIRNVKTELIKNLAEGLTAILVKIDDPFNSLYDYFKIVDDYIKGIIKGMSSFFHSLDVNTTVEIFKEKLEDFMRYYKGFKELEEAIEKGNLKQILHKANQFAEEINADLGNFTGELLKTYTKGKKAEETYNQLDDAVNNTLFNYRSLYDELVAPGLGFNRRTVAMIVNTDWKNVEQRLLITPVITKFNELNENLSALGIRLPSVAITDQFLTPAKEWGKEASEYFKESFLNNYDLTNVVSAGVNLERCIRGFKMPEELRNNIKLTHGTDKPNLKAWAKAESNVTIPERKQLFGIGPVNVSLEQKATLIGNVRAEIDTDSKLTKASFGELNGSFIIGLQNTELMRFRDVKVTCINDKYNFDLDPSRIEMSGLLKLITDATKNIKTESAEEGDDRSVFKVSMLKERFEGSNIEIPYGINAALDIPPITIGGGPSNITNLAFGGNFKMIAFDIQKKKLDFKLGLGFYMGKREAPFVFTAFIFGGGGFIDCNLEYAPSVSNSLSVEFAMSVQASAALAFNGGWIYGSVMVGMGVEVHYIKTAYGPGSNTSVIMFVQFIGHVCVIRIIHVFIIVRLAIAYDGAKMQGTGRIKASVKISRFFTLKVNKNYIHNF